MVADVVVSMSLACSVCSVCGTYLLSRSRGYPQEARLKEIGEGSGRAMALHDAARRKGFTSATEEAWAAASVPPTRRFK